MDRAIATFVSGIVVSGCLTCGAALAQNTTGVAFTDSARFGPYGESYILYQSMQNIDWANDDEWAVRAHYSFGYRISGRENYNLLFTYTGAFDFYLGTRSSSPVVNRISNPAFHLQLPRVTADGAADTAIPFYRRVNIDLGIEHESDGQITETESDEEIADAQQAYADKDRYFFDQISRGSNFISARFELPQGETLWNRKMPIAVVTTARLYFSQDNTVTWGPLANRGTKLSDYNLLSTSIRREQGKLGNFQVTWTLGARGFSTQSFDVDWYVKSANAIEWSVPVFLRWHRGPLNTLSNYSQRQDSIGIGIRFGGF
jgi:hypothetical protein